VAGKKTIGVLALQGAFIEHEAALQRCGVQTRQVRRPQELGEIDGLVIPGGESTTIGKLMQKFGLDTVIKKKAIGLLMALTTLSGIGVGPGSSKY
jgi:5'-phosphate synthase pdxT subunit